MIYKDADAVAETIELGRKYADCMILHHSNRPGFQGWDVYQNPSPVFPMVNNPENIDSGISGAVLFLMALYSLSPEEKYLKAIDALIDDLLIYCKTNPTDNYALYTGRAGVIYVLLHRYSITANDDLLKECLDLIRPANQEFLHSKYTSDFLYDGRAGTLLLIVELYRISEEGFLLEYIDQFAGKIIDNAQLTEKGIFWQAEEELSIGASCSLAFGTAGIKYVFHRLTSYCPDAVLEFVLAEIDKYTDSCWVESFQNWGDFRRDIFSKQLLDRYKEMYLQKKPSLFYLAEDYSWAHGASGILSSPPGKIDRNKWGIMINKIKEQPAGDKFKSNNLYSGTAGLGMCLLQIGQEKNDYSFRESAFRLTGQLTSEAADLKLAGGLLHGRLGEIYFLLQMIDPESISENITRPFARKEKIARHPAMRLSHTLVEVKKNLIGQSYPGLVTLLNLMVPEAFFAYFDKPGSGDSNPEVKKIIVFAEHIIESGISLSSKERLQDLLPLEKEKMKLFAAGRRSSFHIYLDKLMYRDKALACLSKPDEWWLEQELSISPHIKIIKTRWDWSRPQKEGEMDDKAFGRKYKQNLDTPPKQFDYIFQPSDRLGNTETLISSESRLIFQCFVRPKPLGEAIAEIKCYLTSLQEEKLKEILMAIRIPGEYEPKDFLNVAGDQILSMIKKWVYKGILVPPCLM